MRIAALGTAAGATVAALAQALSAPPLLVAIALAGTAPFAILLAAHAGVFLSAARRARAAAPGEGVLLDRRAFVGAGSLAFLAVLLGAPLPAWAGNPGKCKYDKHNDKCDPSDCGTIYDAQGNDVSSKVSCTKLTVDGKTDCYCIFTGADACNDGRGNCTALSKCPDYYAGKNKQKKLKKECVKEGTVCYCAYKT